MVVERRPFDVSCNDLRDFLNYIQYVKQTPSNMLIQHKKHMQTSNSLAGI